MRNYFRIAWRENDGWWLVLASVCVAAIFSMLWFFQWLPGEWITQPKNRPILSQTIQQQNSILVAQVNASPEAAGKRGLILLFLPETAPDQPPSYQQSFQLDESGMVTLLMVFPPGAYTTVAFLDLNDNGQLDFQAGQPLEPMRFPISKSSSESNDLEAPMDITLSPENPVFCLFEFGEI
jgi:hypothetical protein